MQFALKHLFYGHELKMSSMGMHGLEDQFIVTVDSRIALQDFTKLHSIYAPSLLRRDYDSCSFEGKVQGEGGQEIIPLRIEEGDEI